MSEMNGFAGMRELVQEFAQESTEQLSVIDSKLLRLEQSPNDVTLRNDIFREFHSIKGGAGFLNANELVLICQLAENLVDPLRHPNPRLNAETMEALSAATSEILHMLNIMGQGIQLPAASAKLVVALQTALKNS